MEVSLLCPKCTLVPSAFFNPANAGADLSEVAELCTGEEARFISIPQFDAVLLFAQGSDTETLVNDHSPAESDPDPKPEMFYILRDLPLCTEYNKILCSWHAGYLYLAIAQGSSLMLANTYKAVDFTTAEYFLFLAVKSLHLNPEVSTVCWRQPVGPEEEMNLCRYFKAVETV